MNKSNNINSNLKKKKITKNKEGTCPEENNDCYDRCCCEEFIEKGGNITDNVYEVQSEKE